MTKQARVLVNGYGVIGKRIADAVAAQDDMVLVGVADVVSDWRIKVAAHRGYPIFAATPQAAAAMRAAGIPLAGTLAEALRSVDVVCDATPKKLPQPTSRPTSHSASNPSFRVARNIASPGTRL